MFGSVQLVFGASFLIGCAWSGIIRNIGGADELSDWTSGYVLNLSLPAESFEEDFFDKKNEVKSKLFANLDNEELGLPLSPEDFEAGQQLSEKSFAPSKEFDPLQKSGQFEGDIKDPKVIEGRNAIRDNRMKWPRAEVPYVIAQTFDRNERSIIARAMSEYQKQTCIRFIPRSTETDYVFITRKIGCFSMIGRDGGQQLLSLGDGCLYVGVVIHELMHAIGFWHEQSRADRDDYVTIFWENVQQGQTHNFAKYTDGRLHHLGEPYDFDSIMHYGSFDFSKFRNQPTILPKPRDVFIGQRNGFSRTDVRKINKLYRCDSSSSKSDCIDLDSQCRGWAELGECQKNPKWMLANCRKSCNQCRMLLSSSENETLSR